MTKKSKNKSQSSALNTMENNNNQKSSILLRDFGFFVVVITALLYVSAYVCEVITAFYFGYDVDLISLSMSIIIKNNIISLFTIILSLSPIILDYLYGKKNTWKVSTHKNKSIFLFIIAIIVGAGFFVIYKINEVSFFKSFLPSVIIALCILLFLHFFLKSISSSEFRPLLCYLSGLIFIYLFLAGFIFLTFSLLTNKPYYTFIYDKQSYILLRQYGDNFIANKIIQKDLNNQLTYYFCNDILYLPTTIIEQGVIFKSINVSGHSVNQCE